MKPNRMTHIRRALSALLIVAVAVTMLSGLWSAPVGAASTKEILKELQKLREQQSAIEQKSASLASEIAENKKQTQSIVERKSDIDRQMELTNETIDNYNQQIQQYSLLIAEKQKELDAAEAEEQQLEEQYKTRLRAMEETGTISYWSVLFQASSFSDLLDRVDMIHEIAKSDQIMLKKLSDATAAVQESRTELEQERTQMETAITELDAQQATLEEQRAEADALLIEIAEASEQMTAEYQEYLAQEAELSKQIAQSEKDYYQALAKEEAARLAEQNKKNNYVPVNKDSSGFLYPLPYRVAITDSYGYRTHPVTGQKMSWHNGVDFAAGAGTAIYATKSGTVTTSMESSIWGNYVVINHGDGFSSLYAHMQGLIVSAGEYVKQGQVIGYVGSTGLSTGPHLHFTIYYNGSDVNPMNYVG